jgi:hypothetical protein
VTKADVSSPDNISDAYNRAAAQGEIASSVWDGQNVNIITRGGGGGRQRNGQKIQNHRRPLGHDRRA